MGFSTPPSTGAAPSWDAIVEVGGSQQFVSEGRYYECHSLKGVEPGTKIAFERVLATLDGDEPTLGMPYVKGARVEATVLENFKDKKLIVFKYRRKKHYKRKNGHRQPMTRSLVTKAVKPETPWMCEAGTGASRGGSTVSRNCVLAVPLSILCPYIDHAKMEIDRALGGGGAGGGGSPKIDRSIARDAMR